MAKNAEIIVKINTEGAQKNVGDLSNEVTLTVNNLGDLREAANILNDELEKAEFGSEQFNQLNAELIKVNKQIKDLELGMESLDAEQVASEFGSFAAGIADSATATLALSSAMGITDESSLAMIETLSQGMAIAQGFRGGIEGIISFQKLLRNSQLVQNALQAKSIALTTTETAAKGAATAATAAQTAATGGATVAMGLLNAVMAANPIFLLIGGITALVGAFALFGRAADDAKEKQAKLNAELENTTRAADDAGAALDRLASRREKDIDRATQALQKEREILQAKSKLTDEESARLAELNAQLDDLEIDKFSNTADVAQKKIADLRDVASKTFELIESGIDVTDIEDGVNDINYDSLKKRNADLADSFDNIMANGFSEENVGSQIKQLEALRKRVSNYQGQLNKGKQYLGSAEKEEFDSVLDSADKLAGTLDKLIGNADEYQQSLKDKDATKNLQDQNDILEQTRINEEKAREAERRYLDFLKEQASMKAQLLSIQQDLELKAIEDTTERAIRAIEIRKENELKNVKGNTQVAKDLRIAIEKQAQVDITKIRDDARKKELEKEKQAQLEAKLNAIKTAQDEGAELEAVYEEINNVKIGKEQAEINAVRDKYFRLKELAKQHGEDAAAIEEEEERQIKEIEDRFAAEAKAKEDEAFNEKLAKIQEGMKIVADAIGDIMGIVQQVLDQQAEAAAAKREQEYEADSEALKAQLANREISQKQYDERVKLLEQKKEQQELAAKRKAFKQQKAMAIVNAVMSTAQAVIQGMANAFPLNIIMAALAGAVGAAQIGIIASQKFTAARGGVVPGLGPSNIDSVDAKLAPGETVINAQSSSMFPGLLSQINEAGGGVQLAPDVPTAGGSNNNNSVFKENRNESTVKAYVVESEMTTTQKRVDRFERGATF